MAGRLPDFLVIGAPRSGTTWLWELMRNEPGIFVPEEKETSFFNTEAIDFPDRRNPRADWPLERYCEVFADCSPSQICGEVSPAYLASRTAPARIHQACPDVRLVAILRNPVDRAISDYRYRQGRGTVRKLSLAEAINEDTSIVERGLYARHLGRYINLFGRDRLLILEYDDLRSKPEIVAAALGEFLDVTMSGRLPEAVNQSGAPRFRALNRALSSLERQMRRPPLDAVWSRLRDTPARRIVRSVRRPRLDSPMGADVTPDDRHLLAALFEQDQEDLDGILDC